MNTTNMTIGEAIEAIEQGHRCARKCWNGKNQYIEIAKDISFTDAKGNLINADHESMGNHAIVFCGTSGYQVGWLASQADLLSKDWYIVD